ncbi:MAG: endonuclease/exonuclease/phosphatase family protein [Thermodesulfobacteriota bacterium]|nr:endonuclease/exonuclease/phosphatase family protein [Thermodesulfobacteriota bacterium]
MVERIYRYIRRIRKKISRSELAVRLMGLDVHTGSNTDPGLVMLQVDGLSMEQLEKALSQNRLPFIQSLIDDHKFTMKPFYAGIPSTTPAVQGELLFGIKSAVPAFEFIDRKHNKRRAMFFADAAEHVADELYATGKAPLLDGGSSYSNIFAGGAKEARYCVETMHLENLLQTLNPLNLVILTLLHAFKTFRILGVALLEFILACNDFFKGILNGRHFFKELKFIPTRVFICIVLRELIRFRVKMDVSRGVPVIHANFIGYDEQSHRRGPDSAFAHWTLKGIDGVIQDIYRTALRSNCRAYRLILYSDHGQEKTRTFGYDTGISLKQAIRSTVARIDPAMSIPANASPGQGFEYLYARAKEMLAGRHRRGHEQRLRSSVFTPDQVQVTNMGPLAHIYLPPTVAGDIRETLARHLVVDKGIPLVLFNSHLTGTVTAVTPHGFFDLATDKARILGEDHPFLEETARDLEALCRHKNAGDLVVSGWSPNKAPLTFSIENGSHGGPGRHETRGFVLLPMMANTEAPFLRPLDLRKTAFSLMKKNRKSTRPPDTREEKFAINVMSYNIHSCINMNGKADPDTIAAVIDRFDADVVALQEVDRHKERTGYTNQAKLLARYLDMDAAFFPVMTQGDEEYGLALLTRYPVIEMKENFLPGGNHRSPVEKRGAMMARIETPDGILCIVNTHLGLGMKERRLQAKALLGHDWLGQVHPSEPVIICGDMNAGGHSSIYRQFSEKFRDVQKTANQRGYPRPTFFSFYPLLRLDHIFVSRHFQTQSVFVPADRATQMASDHLPIYATLSLDIDMP